MKIFKIFFSVAYPLLFKTNIIGFNLYDDKMNKLKEKEIDPKFLNLF